MILLLDETMVGSNDIGNRCLICAQRDTFRCFIEQRTAKRWAYSPISGKLLHIVLGYAAMQVCIDVLTYFSIGRLDVPWNIQVVIVCLNGVLTADRHKLGIMRHIMTSIPCVHNALDILLAQAVFVAVFHKSVFGIDKENAFAVGSTLLVNQDNRSRYACAEKDIGR